MGSLHDSAAFGRAARQKHAADPWRRGAQKRKPGLAVVVGAAGVLTMAVLSSRFSGRTFTGSALTRGGCFGKGCGSRSGTAISTAATAIAGAPGAEDVSFDPLSTGVAKGKGADSEELDDFVAVDAVAGEPTALQKELRVQALSGRGSFILEMGGQRLLVNPRLDADSPIRPENVHTEFDYVILTSGKDAFFHPPTLEAMSLMKVNFIASQTAAEELNRMMVRNMAVLAPGPEGRTALTGNPGTALIAVMVTPGANAPLPWETPESGFIFVNMETGVAVGYEALGQYCGPAAASTREGIPEEAYQIDYLVTPDLRTASGVVKGLAERGAQLRAVVRLPGLKTDSELVEEANPVLAPFLALDRGVDAALGGIGDDPAEFQAFLAKQDGPLSQIRLLVPTVDAEPVELDGAA